MDLILRLRFCIKPLKIANFTLKFQLTIAVEVTMMEKIKLVDGFRYLKAILIDYNK